MSSPPPSPSPGAPDPPPSPWTVLSEFSKGIVTLSSAIFALTATFSGNLLGKPNGSIYLWILLLSWACLAFSIWSAATCHAFLVNYLRDDTDVVSRGRAIWRANASHITMLLGLLLFAAFAILCLSDKPVEMLDARGAASKTVGAAIDMYKRPASDFALHAANWAERTKTYNVTLDQESRSRRLYFEIDASNGHVVQSSAQEMAKTVVHPDSFEAQLQLFRQGYKPGPIDGVIGKRTTAAIVRFQADHALPTSGMLDQATWAALYPVDVSSQSRAP